VVRPRLRRTKRVSTLAVPGEFGHPWPAEQPATAGSDFPAGPTRATSASRLIRCGTSN